MAKHSIIGPSSAARWIACPPSTTYNKVNKSSSAAELGTYAHALAEEVIQLKLLGKKSKGKYNKLLKNELYNPNILRHAEEFCDYVEVTLNEHKAVDELAILKVEHPINYEEYAPGGFGTSDIVIASDKRLTVIDYKYGRVEVSAEDNPQLKLYALGALEEFGEFADIEKIDMHIYQPNIYNFDYSTIDAQCLLDWAENVVRPAAELAVDGAGKYKSGAHCKYCQHATCSRRAIDSIKPIIKMDENNEDVNDLTVDDIEDILALIPLMKSLITSAEVKAESLLLSGVKLSRHKLIHGRGSRVYTDENKVKELITEHNLEDIAYTKKLLTAPQLLDKIKDDEKLVDIFGQQVHKLTGGPKIAPINSKNKEYSTDTLGFDDVKIKGEDK